MTILWPSGIALCGTAVIIIPHLFEMSIQLAPGRSTLFLEKQENLVNQYIKMIYPTTPWNLELALFCYTPRKQVSGFETQLYRHQLSHF